jgi:alkylhydroperoxidase family enzyme
MPNILAPVPDPIPPGAAEILKRYPQRGGYLLSLFRTFANSVRFLEKGVPNLLDDRSPLSLRQREIVILRVTARRDCEYEWGVHIAAFGKQAGFTAEQIAATRLSGPDEPCWPPEESLLIRVADELCDAGRLSSLTLEGFQATWTLEQQLEILALCGAYHTVSFVANTARLPPEPFGARFPGRT